jgi:hypothetical protein
MASPDLQTDLAGPPSAKGKALILLGFVALYTIACGLPALHLEGPQRQWYGVELMVMGPLGLKYRQIAWFANIDAVIALWCVMQGRTTAAIVLTGVAFGLALQTLWLPGMVIPVGEQEFEKVRVLGVGAGFYVWVAALLIPLAAAFLLRHSRTKSRTEFAG